jgi:hypothetical protein
MESIKIRRAAKDDAEVLLNLIDELAIYEKQPKLAPDIRAEKLGARQLRDRLMYRFTEEELKSLIRSIG